MIGNKLIKRAGVSALFLCLIKSINRYSIRFYLKAEGGIGGICVSRIKILF